VCDVDALGDEGEEALEGVDLVGVEAGVEELGDGGVVGVIVEVRVGAHPPHHPRGRRAARLKSEHPLPAGRADLDLAGVGLFVGRGPPEEGKKTNQIGLGHNSSVSAFLLLWLPVVCGPWSGPWAYYNVKGVFPHHGLLVS